MGSGSSATTCRCATSTDNVVVATRPDRASGDTARIGYGVLSSYHAEVELGDNELGTNPVPVGAVADAHVFRK